ncbi:hypothetical protein LSTR_LSTR014930, partial [Laodelphax striatellus]
SSSRSSRSSRPGSSSRSRLPRSSRSSRSVGSSRSSRVLLFKQRSHQSPRQGEGRLRSRAPRGSRTGLPRTVGRSRCSRLRIALRSLLLSLGQLP